MDGVHTSKRCFYCHLDLVPIHFTLACHQGYVCVVGKLGRVRKESRSTSYRTQASRDLYSPDDDDFLGDQV